MHCRIRGWVYCTVIWISISQGYANKKIHTWRKRWGNFCVIICLLWQSAAPASSYRLYQVLFGTKEDKTFCFSGTTSADRPANVFYLLIWHHWVETERFSNSLTLLPRRIVTTKNRKLHQTQISLIEVRVFWPNFLLHSKSYIALL